MTMEIIKLALQIGLALVMILHLIVKRRERKRAREANLMRDPRDERRTPAEYDPHRIWQLEADVTALKTRMDRAGRELSDLATKVQGLPETLRDDFLILPLANEWAQQCKGDRIALHATIAELRDEINRLRESRPWPRSAERKG
jgi:hypothetical protein